MLRDTSLAAYDELKAGPKLANQERRLLCVMAPGTDYSLQELAHLSGIAINAVSGRVNGLKAKGVLTESPARACRITGRTIHPVALERHDEEMD